MMPNVLHFFQTERFSWKKTIKASIDCCILNVEYAFAILTLSFKIYSHFTQRYIAFTFQELPQGVFYVYRTYSWYLRAQWRW